MYMSCPHSWSLAPHVSHSAALPQHTWAPQSQQQRSVALKAVSTTVLKSACHDLRPGRDAAARQHLVTLTTQCSLDRWPRFLQQAESWAGPVSVAVYIPAPEQTSAADACLQLLQHWAASHAAAHPQQRLHVAALFADHYAWEGASVLEEAAGLTSLHPHANQPSSTGQPPAQAAAAAAAAQHSPTVQYDQLYPINALRNVALQHASTPVVLPVDVDFLFSQDLEQQLHRHEPGHSVLASSPTVLDSACGPAAASGGKAAQGAAAAAARADANDAKAAAGGHLPPGSSLSIVDQLLYSQQHQPHRHLLLVLPAFQLVLPPSNQPQQLRTQPQRPQQQQASQPALQQQQPKAVKQGGTVPDTVHVRVPSTKPELLQALQEGSVREFDCGVFAPQKQPLDLDAWCTAQQPLELQYVDCFEVHGGLAVKGPQLPPYSEAFRGYGLNKQQHAWHAAALGYRFMVLPDAFIVTAPHKRSSSWRPTPGTAADAAHLQRIRRVYESFKQQLAQQGLAPKELAG